MKRRQYARGNKKTKILGLRVDPGMMKLINEASDNICMTVPQMLELLISNFVCKTPTEQKRFIDNLFPEEGIEK